jgi:hypothetical protein
VNAKTLAVLDREPMVDQKGKLLRAWRIAFFDYLKGGYGIWKAVEYLAGNFSWTVQAGDQTTFAYCLMGKRLDVALVLVTTAGAGASVTVAIPADLTAARSMTNLVMVDDNGTFAVGKARVTAGASTITITRLDGAAFTDLRAVEGVITFEVN